MEKWDLDTKKVRGEKASPVKTVPRIFEVRQKSDLCIYDRGVSTLRKAPRSRPQQARARVRKPLARGVCRWAGARGRLKGSHKG